MKELINKPIIRIPASAVLFAAGLIVPGKTVSAVLFLIAYAVSGYDVVISAFKNIFHGELFDECFLMTVATAGAVILGEYPEAAAVMILYQIGEWVGDLASDKARESISKLISIRPDRANVLLDDGTEKTVSPEDVGIGELIIVRPGERIPLDGIIESGSGSFDTSALTGESLPRDLCEGDAAVCGAVNLTGVIKVRVTGTFGESAVSRIIRSVENASEKKAAAESFIRRFSRIYTPVVVGLALSIGIIPPLFGCELNLFVYRALTFLVASCPCAVVISVPLGFFCGMGGASKKGILIKGGVFIESLAKATDIALDKTGTLTRGELKLDKVVPERLSEEEFLTASALVQYHSDHPIAKSIKKGCTERLGELPSAESVSDFKNIPGMGVTAMLGSHSAAMGSLKLMEHLGVEVKNAASFPASVYLALDGKYEGFISLSDTLKPNAKDSLDRLKELGAKRITMLTGDSAEVAGEVAREVGADDFVASLLPETKALELEKIKSSDGRPIVFVGDGINDAPVLAHADVGISMGGIGSDAAIEASDVVILDDDISKIPEAIEHSRKTMKIVRENIAGALSFKAAVLIISAFGIAFMPLAVFADVGVTLIATANSLRALK